MEDYRGDDHRGYGHRAYRGVDQAHTWLQLPAFPQKGREHPLVEKGRRAGLEGRAEERPDLFLWLSAPRFFCLFP